MGHGTWQGWVLTPSVRILLEYILVFILFLFHQYSCNHVQDCHMMKSMYDIVHIASIYYLWTTVNPVSALNLAKIRFKSSITPII